MREIRFRAWDKKNNEMIDWLELVSKVMFFNYIDNEDYPLMQDTSLKDKNGVAIYEGDIIKVNSETAESIGEPEIVSVVWEEESAAFFTSNHRYLWLVVGKSYTEGEVIGNIWENPELLQKGTGK